MTAKKPSIASELRKLASSFVVNSADPFETGQISLRNTGTLFQAADEIDRLRLALEYYANKASWSSTSTVGQMLFVHGDAAGGWVIAGQALGEDSSPNSID